MFSTGCVLIGQLGHMSKIKQEVPLGRISSSAKVEAAVTQRKCKNEKKTESLEDLLWKKKEAKQNKIDDHEGIMAPTGEMKFNFLPSLFLRRRSQITS